MKFTIVIPFYNEETSVSPMFKRLVPVCKSLKDFEILCIDDGSTDKTLINLKEEQKNCPQLKIIKFHKNAGQSAAFAAGFKEAAGDIIITLDGDLQNPPEEIPLIVSALNNADMAVGWRHERQDTFSKKIASKLANGLRRYVLDDKVHDTGCSLKGFKKEVAKNIPLERLLIETDSPYLAPEPFRGESNQPQYVKYVAEHIAEIRQISYNEVVEATSQNAIKLFGLN